MPKKGQCWARLPGWLEANVADVITLSPELFLFFGGGAGTVSGLLLFGPKASGGLELLLQGPPHLALPAAWNGSSWPGRHPAATSLARPRFLLAMAVWGVRGLWRTPHFGPCPC